MQKTSASITDRQHQVLDYIVNYLSANDCQPTYREIADAMGIKNVNGVVCHINALVARGYVKKRAKHLSRSLQIDWDMYRKGRKNAH